jgi:ankyrin repeat protein
MSLARELLAAFESHRPDQISALLAAGVDPRKRIDGKRPIDCLIEMYLRSPAFDECLKVMLGAGATIRNPALQAVLLDDARALRTLLTADAKLVTRTLNMPCTFTPLTGASLLHVCAEYNRVRCAKVLLKAGADLNRRAAVDREGLGGHTPLFHTVNSHHNFARPMMELLADAGADLTIQLTGLVWGASFEWETTLYDVTPISYAQFGLLRQFQRREEDIYANITYLCARRDGVAPLIRNVPNKYLQS